MTEPKKPDSDKSPAKNPPAPPAESGDEFGGEIGGPAGPEPTRYGDWERNGRVSDF